MQIEMEKRHKPRRFHVGYGVTVPVVLVLSIYLFLVLAANSGVGTRWVIRLVDSALPGSLLVEDLAIGPSLSQVQAHNIVFKDIEGRPVIEAESVTCSIQLTAFLSNELQLYHCLASTGRVLVQELPNGEVGIASVFDNPEGSKGKRGEQLILNFNDVSLYDVDVLVNLDDLALLFQRTQLRNANIRVSRDGFHMTVDRLLAQGGRIFLSERLMGLGPGHSNAQTLRWDLQRMQTPWKIMDTPYPDTLDPRAGGLDVPLDHLDIQSLRWQREQLLIGAGHLKADDMEATVRGWLQFLPERPGLPHSERGIVSFDGLTELKVTADSAFFQLILPQTLHTHVGIEPESTAAPMVMKTYGNLEFANASTYLSLHDIDILGWHLGRFDGRLSLQDGHLKLAPGASADLWDGLITGDGELEPRTGLWKANLCFDDIDFEKLATPLRQIIAGDMPEWMQARISTTPAQCDTDAGAGLVLHGDLTSKAGFMRDPARQLPAERPTQDPMLTVEKASVFIKWKRGISNTPLEQARIQVGGFLDQRGVFHIEPQKPFQLRGASATFQATGSLDTNELTLDTIHAKVQIDQLSPWLKAMGVSTPPDQATVTMDLRMGGTIDQPQARTATIDFRIPSNDLHYPEMRVKMSLEQDEDAMKIGHFHFDSPVGGLEMSGRATLFRNQNLMQPITDPSMDVLLKGSMLDLGLIPLNTDADGRLVEGNLRIHGRLSNLNISGPFLFDNVRAAGESFDIIQGEAHYEHGIIVFNNLDLVRGKGRVHGTLRYDPKDDSFDIRAVGKRLALMEFTAFQKVNNLRGTLAFDMVANGTLRNLHVQGSTILDDLRLYDQHIGDIVLAWDTSKNTIHGTGLVGRDINVHINLPTSLDSAVIDSWFQDFPWSDHVPGVAESFKGSSITGRLQADVDIEHHGRLLRVSKFDAKLPIDQLKVAIGDQRMHLKQPDCDITAPDCERPTLAFQLIRDDDNFRPSLQFHDIAIGESGHYVALEGTADGENVDVQAHGDFELALLRLFPDLIVDAKGIAHMRLSAKGPTSNPDIKGEIGIQHATIAPRDLGTSLFIDHVRFEIDGNRITIPADPASRLTGTLFNGDISVSGIIDLDSFVPNSMDLAIHTMGLAYRVPDMLNIILNTDLQLTVGDMTDAHSWALAGDVEIVEGRYYRDVDLLSENFSFGGIGRSISTFSQPIWQTNPIIKYMETDLNILGRDRLRVMNSIANAELNLELKTDLKLTGQLGHMNLTGEMTILDTSRVYYGDRRFKIRDGALIFDGYLDDEGFPWPFIDTRLYTNFKSQCYSRRRGTLDATQTQSNLVRTINEAPTIRMDVEVNGRLPLDINYTLDSQPSYDQRDQISLILTGCSIDELVASSGTGPGLELLFRPVISVVERNVEQRFNIDDVDLIPTPDGSADILVEDEVSDRLRWTLDATVGSGEATRQALSSRLTIRNGLELELLQESNPINPFSLSGALRFRWRLE